LEADKTTGTGDNPSPAAVAERRAFVERLQIILAHWPSVDRLARAVGVSPSAFRKWLRGEAEPSRERLLAVARTAGVGVAWLAGGEGPEPVFGDGPNARRRPAARQPQESVDKENFLLLPRQEEAAAAGSETPDAPFDGAIIALRHDWIRAVCGVEPNQLALETAVGESMSPTIRDGATLLIDTTDRTFRGFGIYVLEIGGQRLVKRVQRNFDGSLVLISDNTTYFPDAVDKAAARDITVIGRVVWAGGPV
jgi:phage repressor protein C with HTH and peptisase S24 domain